MLLEFNYLLTQLYNINTNNQIMNKLTALNFLDIHKFTKMISMD